MDEAAISRPTSCQTMVGPESKANALMPAYTIARYSAGRLFTCRLDQEARLESLGRRRGPPSPGILTRFVVDTYYRNEDAYLQALADVMKTEYEAIIGAGLLLQLDCPDLGSARHNQHRDKTDEEFLRIAERATSRQRRPAIRHNLR